MIQLFRSMRLRLPIILAFGILGLIGATCATGQQSELPRLTLFQIEELATHGVPDSTLSAQVVRRGITFVPTQPILDELHAKGVGPQTILAISHQNLRVKRSEGHAEGASEESHAELNHTQLWHLLRIHASDSFVAEQIRSHGLSFPVAQNDIEMFENAGAGPNTLATLQQYVVTGSVEVDTNSGASVFLDGKLAGSADTSGKLRLQNVLAGQHSIVAKKSGFRDNTQSFVLDKREAHLLSIPLQSIGGYLSVAVEPSQGSISVSGPASFTGPRAHVPCPPGDYVISATAVGYLPQTQQAHIEDGSNAIVTVNLEADPGYVKSKLSEGSIALSSGNLHQAEEDARSILSLAPQNGAAEALLAETAFEQGDSKTFVDAATDAIHSGFPPTVRLMHLHKFPNLKLEGVQVTVSRLALAFSGGSDDKKNRLPESLPFSTIQTLQPRALPDGTMELFIQWVPSSHHSVVSVLHDIEFVVDGSEIARTPGTVAVIGSGGESVHSPATAWATLTSLANLCTHLR